MRHLRARESILVVHISNHYLELSDQLWALADSLGFAASSILTSQADSAASGFPFDMGVTPTVSTTPIRRNGAGWKTNLVRHRGMPGGTGVDAALSAVKETP
jgi:hypothetical protein